MVLARRTNRQVFHLVAFPLFFIEEITRRMAECLSAPQHSNPIPWAYLLDRFTKLRDRFFFRKKLGLGPRNVVLSHHMPYKTIRVLILKARLSYP